MKKTIEKTLEENGVSVTITKNTGESFTYFSVDGVNGNIREHTHCEDLVSAISKGEKMLSSLANKKITHKWDNKIRKSVPI